MVNTLPELITTERLTLRVAKPGDGVILNEGVLESIDQLVPWLPWASPTPSAEDSELACRKAYARFLLNEDLMMLFLLRDTGVIIGASGLHRVNWKLRQFEVGYWGRTKFGGLGLMTEGVRALSDYALTVLAASRVHLTVDDRNLGSCRLAERAGFSLEGILRNESLDMKGQLRNIRIYARVTS